MENSSSIKKRNREATIEKLLEAAVAVFSVHGYDAATTKLIAKEAGVNESLISRYFEGKSGLLVEIIRGFMEKECSSGACKIYPEGETLQQDIFNFFNFKFNHYLQVSPFLKVVFSRAIIDPKVALELQKFTNKGTSPLLLERLVYFQEKGIIRADVNLERTCFMICNTSFSVGFLGYTVMGLDRDFVLAALLDFSRNFSVGMSA